MLKSCVRSFTSSRARFFLIFSQSSLERYLFSDYFMFHLLLDNISNPISPPQIEKIGHRRVNLAGVVSYKKTPADQLKRGIQMGLEHFIGQISNKPVRDLLIQVRKFLWMIEVGVVKLVSTFSSTNRHFFVSQDFEVIESVHFPSDGSQMTVVSSLTAMDGQLFAMPRVNKSSVQISMVMIDD